MLICETVGFGFSEDQFSYSNDEPLQAFQHLLQSGLVGFIDGRGHNQAIEFRPVKLLISLSELTHGLKSYNSCPVSFYFQ